MTVLTLSVSRLCVKLGGGEPGVCSLGLVNVAPADVAACMDLAGAVTAEIAGGGILEARSWTLAVRPGKKGLGVRLTLELLHAPGPEVLEGVLGQAYSAKAPVQVLIAPLQIHMSM